MDAAGTRPLPRAGGVVHEAIWGPIAVLALLAARFFPFDRFGLGPCPFHAVTGLACPTCGGTRALMELSRVHLLEALAMNPLMALLGLAGAAYAVHAAGVWLLGWRRWSFAVASERTRRALRIAAVTALLVNWAYLIGVGR